MSNWPKVYVGQVWRERDGRFERDVKILAIEGERAVIQSATGRGSRTRALLRRFGPDYELIRESPADQHFSRQEDK